MRERPRPATIEEYEELIAMLTRAYGKISVSYWSQHYPQLYRKEAEKVANLLILKEAGRVVSHVGLFPMELQVLDKTLKVGGIGGVATLPKYRGRGFMSELLGFAIGKIVREGFHLSVLWGDRQRYASFGWERGVLATEFLLTPRSLLRSNVSKTEAWKYGGDEADLRSIRAMHKAEPIRVLRSPETYRLLMGKAGVEVWLSERAYVVLSEGRGYSSEFGGDGASLLSLIRMVLEVKEMPEVRISLPLWDRNRFKAFFDASVDWYLEPTAMVRIVNLAEVLRAFAPMLDLKESGAFIGEGLQLQILEDGQAATLWVDEGGLRVLEGLQNPAGLRRAVRLSLSRVEMTRLLFSYARPSEVPGLPQIRLLDALFPLSPYIWSLDHV